ncbi:hypothetical protein [Breznakibacter xylanolyticus]|uniref:hypothetical protein n=1 Tax=Breznakibacter xylanolyticus TaxID=990 RepID=UPI001472A74B|nr:hypothetical protein [Breznakibacter xylanolyticus]
MKKFIAAFAIAVAAVACAGNQAPKTEAVDSTAVAPVEEVAAVDTTVAAPVDSTVAAQ